MRVEPVGGRQRAQRRVAHEVVDEGVAAGRVLDEAQRPRARQGVGHERRRGVGDPGDLAGRDVHAEERGDADDPLVVRGELPDERGDGALETAEDAAVERAALRDAPHVQRVAAGDRGHHVQQLGRHPVDAEGGEVVAHGRRRQSAQLDPRGVSLQLAEQLARRQILDLLAPGEDEQRGEAAPLADEEAREEQRGGIGHVSVVQHDDERGRAGHGPEVLEHRHEPGEAVMRGLGPVRRQQMLGGAEIPQDPLPRPQRRRLAVVPAASEAHARAVGARPCGQLLGETGLSQAGLTTDHRQPRLALPRLAQRPHEPAELGAPADEQGPRRAPASARPRRRAVLGACRGMAHGRHAFLVRVMPRTISQRVDAMQPERGHH